MPENVIVPPGALMSRGNVILLFVVFMNVPVPVITSFAVPEILFAWVDDTVTLPAALIVFPTPLITTAKIVLPRVRRPFTFKLSVRVTVVVPVIEKLFHVIPATSRVAVSVITNVEPVVTTVPAMYVKTPSRNWKLFTGKVTVPLEFIVKLQRIAPVVDDATEIAHVPVRIISTVPGDDPLEVAASDRFPVTVSVVPLIVVVCCPLPAELLRVRFTVVHASASV